MEESEFISLNLSNDELIEIHRMATVQLTEIYSHINELDQKDPVSTLLKDRYKNRIDILNSIITKIDSVVSRK